jgi:hypothetical protein
MQTVPMKPILLLVFVLLVSSSILGQQPESSGLIKTAEGFLVVWNEPGNYYTIELKAKEIQALQNPLWFKLDGKFFQMLAAGKREFLKDEKTADDKAVLIAHEKWESDYLMGLIGRKFDVKSSWTKLANGHDALMWSYDMPKIDERQTVLRQLYLTTIKGDHVFGLNVPVEPGDDEKRLWQLLTDTIDTLKPSDRPLKLEDASRMVKGN